MMKFICLYVFVLTSLVAQAQVGIGTTTPSANSVLDVTSPDKGIMLPRLADTTSVSNPSAGLMIYDIEAAAPAFHDGVKWNSVAAINAMTSTNDSITYTISSPARMLGFVAGTYPVRSISSGASNTGTESFLQDLAFTKTMDQNSIPFHKAAVGSSDLNVMIIEFKVYEPNGNTPYYSIKLTGGEVTSFQVGISSIDMFLYEQISLNPTIIGFKNWTNNQSYAYNLLTHGFVPY